MGFCTIEFGTGKLYISRSKLCTAWLLALDSVHIWECVLRHCIEQHIKSGQKPEQPQLDESLLREYRRVSRGFI